MVKSLIITGFGINCEKEMAAAYKLADAEATIVHFNELIEEKYVIHDFDIINIPGGFSFGDDIAAGRVMANKIKYQKTTSGKLLIDEINIFIRNGKFILGICNGFQILVKAGLLPNTNKENQQEVSLIHNDSSKFENRWVNVKVNPKSNSPFLSNLDMFPLPVRHGEGKLIIPDPEIRNNILSNHLNCLSYVDDSGNPTQQYPENPNGSDFAIAGLCDLSGQILGIMPHPEAYLSFYNHPNWNKEKIINPSHDEYGWGLKIFQNIVNHISSNVKMHQYEGAC